MSQFSFILNFESSEGDGVTQVQRDFFAVRDRPTCPKRSQITVIDRRLREWEKEIRSHGRRGPCRRGEPGLWLSGLSVREHAAE